MTTNIYLNKDQWDKLNNDQKNSFQDEIGKIFKNNEFPEYSEILNFLGNNKLIELASYNLTNFSIPPTTEDIETHWEKVLTFFNI